MTPYIVMAIIVIGMGASIPFALRWDRQQRERSNRQQ